MNKNYQAIKKLTFTAIFAALSVVLYTVIPKFSLPIFPSFLEINFSMIPIVICAFMLGPINGTICVIIRFLVKLPFSSTMFVGETADLLLGLPIAIVAGVIYNKTNWKHKELIAFISAFFVWILGGVITNAFINIPFYAFMFNGLDPIIAASSAAFNLISGGAITEVTADNFMTYYLLLAVIPFNAILAAIVLFITWLIHKRLKTLYDLVGQRKKS